MKRIKNLLAPPETRRGQLLALAVKSWRIVRVNGPSNLVLRAWRKLSAHIGMTGTGYPSATRYQEWLAFHESKSDQVQQRELRYRPCIRVIATGKSTPAQLRAALDSLIAQSYEHWFCVIEEAAEASILTEYARREPRIQISSASTGASPSGNAPELLAFLDLRDVVAPQWLFEAVRRFNDKPDTDIVYCDEDRLSADGVSRSKPLFKPSWSPDLLLSTNFLANAVVRRELAEAAGSADGSCDFYLRCAEQARRIEHVPRVYYHRHDGSASSLDPLAVEGHCRRIGLTGATANVDGNGVMRVVWPASGATVSIIIPTKDKVALLRQCVQSILRQTGYANYEIILVDNQSVEPATHAYYDSLRSDPRIRIIDYAESFNYSTANNIGVRHAVGERLLFLNNDTEVLEAGWLDELVRWADRPEIGVVGAKLLYSNRTVQHAGVILGMSGFCGHIYRGVAPDHAGMFGSLNWYRNYLAVTGACLMMRRDVFERIGGFDDGYRLGYGDIEICLRAIKHGYRVVCTPFAPMLHHEGRTRFNHLPLPDMRRAYLEMGPSIEAGDPYFNPNLSYSHFLPTLAEPNEASCRERLRQVMRESGAGKM
ncbi:MAG: glycosyltransferase [Planctomycetes bacterium]|nr:glycosyltransferase [Planctomycetota bacterium]